jgi:hypothetical protein
MDLLRCGLVLGGVLLAVVGCGGDGGERKVSSGPVPLKVKSADAEHGGRHLPASLTGAAEVPGPGDADGTGTALLTLNQGQNEVCFDIGVQNIETATRAHIHVGGPTVAGGIVVALFEAGPTPPATGSFPSGCVAASPELIKSIRQNPDGFYVNVHNGAFPAGAIRGQLSK